MLIRGFTESVYKYQRAVGVSDQCRFLGNCSPTPPPKSTLTLTSHLGHNVGFGEGWVEHEDIAILGRSCAEVVT